MIVKATLDRMGNLHIDPKNQAVREKMKKEFGYHQHESLVFIQFYVEESVNSFVPKRLRKDLFDGWDVYFRMDDDTFASLRGENALNGLMDEGSVSAYRFV